VTTLDRFTKVGIQRELHIEWFDQAARLQSMGYSKSDARQEIYAYLDAAPGFETTPSLQTKTYIANALIKSWLAPDQDLIPLRNAALQLLQENPNMRLPIHWSLLGAAYPFWFSVAAVIGRLLNLQSQVTQLQIVSRLKEKFGDRQTVSRRARYVIRSFVAWGILKDVDTKGCYEKAALVSISEPDLAILMLESALLATPEAKCALRLLLTNPAFFPFQLPMMTGDTVSQRNSRIEVLRYGLDDELLALRSGKKAGE
jgi:hypothetical protein